MTEEYMKITIDSGQKGEKYTRYWNVCVGAGRANEGLRTSWQCQLKKAVQECGFSYVRFHGMLMDDMFVFRILNGKEVYNWQYLDDLIDALLDIGIRPFVEFSFTPADMASGDSLMFWWKGHASPPKDFGKWGELIEKTVTHWVNRYGIEEVRKWYFECWNEANLYGLFWTGTKTQYFELYKITAEAVKGIDKTLRIGGPATSNFVPDERFDDEIEDTTKHAQYDNDTINNFKWKGVWIEDFLNYCALNNVPVDFVSTHPYPTDFAIDGAKVKKGRTRYLESLYDDLSWLRDVIKKSEFPNAEIHLTEWNSSPVSRDYSHDYLPAATYIVKVLLDCVGFVDSIAYWAFSDIFEEEGGGPEAFHGGFGLINMQGVSKPTYNAYRLLNTLGDMFIGKGSGYFATKDSEDKFALVLYNYPEEIKTAPQMSIYPDNNVAENTQKTGKMQKIELHINGLRKNTVLIVETLDSNNGCVTTLWKEMGYPKMLSKDQAKLLKRYAEQTKLSSLNADSNGNINVVLELEPWAVVSIREIM